MKKKKKRLRGGVGKRWLTANSSGHGMAAQSAGCISFPTHARIHPQAGAGEGQQHQRRKGRKEGKKRDDHFPRLLRHPLLLLLFHRQITRSLQKFKGGRMVREYSMGHVSSRQHYHSHDPLPPRGRGRERHPAHGRSISRELPITGMTYVSDTHGSNVLAVSPRPSASYSGRVHLDRGTAAQRGRARPHGSLLLSPLSSP